GTRHARVHRATKRAPGRRYATAAALAEDLQRFLADRPIQARPVGARERLVKWAKRRPAAAALVAVSVLAVLSLLVGGWWHNIDLRRANQVAEARLYHSLVGEAR